jgi:hypothetical protein
MIIFEKYKNSTVDIAPYNNQLCGQIDSFLGTFLKYALKHAPACILRS